MFDVKGSDDRKKIQQKIWGVDMTAKEDEFYENMKLVPRRGYCTTYIERKWAINNKRKLERSTRSRNESYDKDYFKGVSSENIEINDSPLVEVDGHVDETYKPPSPKKRKHSYDVELDYKDDPLPNEYQHPRKGLRSVRPELYALMHF